MFDKQAYWITNLISFSDILFWTYEPFFFHFRINESSEWWIGSHFRVKHETYGIKNFGNVELHDV